VQKAKLIELLKTELKPLTHRSADGAVYQRLPKVESELRSALYMDSSEWLARTEISNADHPKFVSEECLVYVLRAALAAGQSELVNSVTEVLFDRAEKRINGYVHKSLAPEYREEAAADMIGDLFMKLCNLKTDADDFAQVRFWMYLKRLCNESRDKYLRYERNDRKTDFIDAPAGEDEAVYEIESAPSGYSSIDWADGQKGLDVLPEPIRTAYILRNGRNWQIDSLEPNVPTLSKHFGKTEKTIRNWLARAEVLLSEWREAQVI
jgi:hypothetical protein